MSIAFMSSATRALAHSAQPASTSRVCDDAGALRAAAAVTITASNVETRRDIFNSRMETAGYVGRGFLKFPRCRPQRHRNANVLGDALAHGTYAAKNQCLQEK